MLARGAIHNPKIFHEYKNMTSDNYLINSEDTDVFDNDYEEIQDEEENTNSNKCDIQPQRNQLKHVKNNEEDLRISNRLSKIFEKKYTKNVIDIVPILRDFVELCLETGNAFNNSKYNVLYILKTHKKQLELFEKIQNSKNYEEMCSILEIKEKYEFYLKSCENMSKFYNNSYYRELFKKNIQK